VICRPFGNIRYIAYLCKKFDDSSVSYSWGMFRALKFKVDHLTWPRPFQGLFVVLRLWLAHSTCTSNLKSLKSPITKMHKAAQNVEIGGLISLAVIPSLFRGTVTWPDVYDKVALRCGESVVNWPFAAIWICRLSRLGVLAITGRSIDTVSCSNTTVVIW